MKVDTTDSETLVRNDGSEIVPVVYLDADGRVITKAVLQPGQVYDVESQVDDWFNVIGADLSSELSGSNANPPESPTHDPPANNWQRLENVVVDANYRPD